jgi:hypothetical protein
MAEVLRAKQREGDRIVFVEGTRMLIHALPINQITSPAAALCVFVRERERERVNQPLMIGLWTIAGKPKHIDRHATSSEDLRKIWMDFFLLAECDVTIASSSNFSRLSVYRELYCPHVCNEVTLANTKTTPDNKYGTPCDEQHLLPVPRARPVALSTTTKQHS